MYFYVFVVVIGFFWTCSLELIPGCGKLLLLYYSTMFVVVLTNYDTSLHLCRGTSWHVVFAFKLVNSLLSYINVL